MHDQNASSRRRLILLRDSVWPESAPVCCWRSSVHAAFDEAGWDVVDRDWPQPDGSRTSTGSGGFPTPDLARRIATRVRAAARWRWRRLVRRLARDRDRVTRRLKDSGLVISYTSPRKREVTPASLELGEVDLVIAESAQAAIAALNGGTQPFRVLTLVLPGGRGFQGARLEGYAAVGEVVNRGGGVLTDSEAARASVERAFAKHRPRVVVMPPLAVDHVCGECGSGYDGSQGNRSSVDAGPPPPAATVDVAGVDDPQEEDDAVAAPSAPPDEPELPMAPRVLGLWHDLLWDTAVADDRQRDFSDVAARLLGPNGSWSLGGRAAWGPSGDHSTPPAVPGAAVDGWTSAAQVACARRLRQAVPPVTDREGRNVVISGFDLKFISELGHRLDEHPDLSVQLDAWPRISSGSSRTDGLVDSADAVVAEWARPSAVYLADRKRPDQTLIVRLHRFEIEHDYPRQIAIDRVDGVVYIAPLMGRRIRDELGWPAEKLVYIPNFIDMEWLDRPKLPDARFGLGLVGMVPSLKRLDLALTIISRLRAVDPRYTLYVRSAMPWQNEYAWMKPEEQEYYAHCFSRIESDPLLRSGVIFDQVGRDMAEWYRKVGTILSLSDIEGSHLSLADGMAAGCVPVVRPWAGARDIYGSDWIFDDVERAVEFVMGSTDEPTWAARSKRAKEEIGRTHSPRLVEQAWSDLILGDVAGARQRFADWTII